MFSNHEYAKDVDWTKPWKLVYDVTIEEKLRAFQFKVLHRILATNEFLRKNKIKDDSTCQNCEHEETLEHLFWDCKEVKAFWSDFKKYYEQISNE